MSRTLLMLTYHFPPSAACASFRLLGFARHLVKHDWNTVVVSPGTLPWEPVDKELRNAVPPTATLREVPYPQGRLAWPLRKLAPLGVWALRALPAVKQAVQEHRPDAVLTSSPPHLVHLLGLFVKRLWGLPWLADFRDPCIGTARDSAFKHWRLRCLEHLVLSRADAVIANTPGAARRQRQMYPALGHKVVAITNGYDPEPFAGLAWPGRRDKLRLLHAGELYGTRDPRPFLDALAAVVRRAPQPLPLEVVFFGRTPGLPELARARGLEGIVHAAGQVSHQRALREMAETDILVLLQNVGLGNRVAAKLYEYLGARRPILALDEPGSDVHDVLKESGVPFWLVSPADGQGLARVLGRLVESHRAGRSFAVPELTAACFTRERLTDKLAACLEALVQRHEAAPVRSREDGFIVSPGAAKR